MRRLGVVLTLLLVFVVSSCSGDTARDTLAENVDTGDPAAFAPTEDSIRERCVSEMPEQVPIRDVLALGDGDATTVPAVVIGPEQTSDTVLVLMHQVGSALCGWGRFATAAAEQGVTSVLVDLCGYGDAQCPEGSTAAVSAQLGLGLAVELGATRTALVGASMGGSETVLAMAGGTEADAWVDVSGPSSWAGVQLLTVAPQIKTPGLVIFARSDGQPEYAAGKALARSAGAEFLDGGNGHGYELLTDYEGRLIAGGERLLAFAQGG
ncbi:MAG: alpha/beta hydrolase [Nocardioides sp.]|nr:alpha/beta hydrolase [Nocardioides sp.]